MVLIYDKIIDIRNAYKGSLQKNKRKSVESFHTFFFLEGFPKYKLSATQFEEDCMASIQLGKP